MILTIIFGLLGLGIIIFVHEVGHFIAAHFCGVIVETFSLGWGPVLLRKKIGQTEYRLSLIPIGGYCGMKGDKAFQVALEEGLSHIPREEGSFYSVHPLKRILIAFSGPFSNFLFAIIAFSIIALMGYSYQSADNRVIIVPDINSAAEKAGIKTGDYILSIDGKQITNFNDIVQAISIQPEKKLSFQIDRQGEYINTAVVPALNKSTGTGQIGVMSWVELNIASVEPNSSAAIAGLTKGDKIIAVNGNSVQNTVDIQKILSDKPVSISVTYTRAEEHFTVPVVIQYDVQGIPLLGLIFKMNTYQSPHYSLFSAIWHGIKETFNMITLTVKSIGLLFRGVDATQAVSGPVRITVMLGDTIKNGFSAGFNIGVISVLNFLALISVSLFIMNLLPIPVLDGGLILFSLIELIQRKAVSPKTLYKVQFIGIAFIMIIFIFALFGDIRYLFTR